MNKILKIVLSLPKTIVFNFRYLPCNQALKMPIFVKYDTKCNIKGKVQIEDSICKFAMIRIGFHEVFFKDTREKTLLSVKGNLIFKGSAHIGSGSRIQVGEGGVLCLGDNFAISASSSIRCYKRIVFGKDIQFAWDCLVMDSDMHTIFDEWSNVCNSPKEIIFGDKIWIGCRSTILKGSMIPSNCVIGACSVVSGNKFEENTIIVGNPAKSVKKIGGWNL